MVEDATVSAAEIARLAGVGRAAVSNWRRRHGDFPQPAAGTASSPLFALTDVERWLREAGKLREVPAEERVWQLLRARTDDRGLAGMIGLVGTFLLYIERDGDAWRHLAARDDAEVARWLPAALAGLRDLPGDLPTTMTAESVRVLRDLAELAADRGAARMFDFCCERYLEVYARQLITTPPQVASLIADLIADLFSSEQSFDERSSSEHSDGDGEGTGGQDTSSPDAGPGTGVLTVFDPACGSGSLLLAAQAHGSARLAGQDRDAGLARIAAVRLLLHAAPGAAPASVAAGDSLLGDAFAGVGADAVVCNPPFGDRNWGHDELVNDPRWEYGLPARGESELAWVQHALAHLRPGGRAVILMPPAAAGRRSGRRIRAQLLRSGALRAVVALPPEAAPWSVIAPHLWLLRRPVRGDELPSRVLMADASGAGGDRLAAIVARAGRVAYRAGQPGADGRAVPLVDLLDDEVDVTPGRHLERPVDRGVARAFDGTRKELADALRGLERIVPELFSVAGPVPDLVMTTVGEQSRGGGLTVLTGPLRMDLGAGRYRVLTTKDVLAGEAASGRTPAAARQSTLLPGDVVVAVFGRPPAAQVVTGEDVVLGPHLVALRADAGRFDPYFLAGFLRIAGQGGVARSRAGSPRLDIRRARFPRLTLEEQRRYGAAFRELAEFDAALRQAGGLGASLVRLGFEGLGSGSLRPPG